MAIGKSSRTGFVGKMVRRAGPIGKAGKGPNQKHHGSKFMEDFSRAKVQYPTTTTTT